MQVRVRVPRGNFQEDSAQKIKLQTPSIAATMNKPKRESSGLTSTAPKRTYNLRMNRYAKTGMNVCAEEGLGCSA